jgi:3-hydroxyisobutyrate dehydrogenase
VARIAFIGIGTMGLPMARNLLAAGHDVVACDLDPERAGLVGGQVASTAREAANSAQVAIASLPSAAAVEEVAQAIAGSGVRSFVDMSTGPPSLARRLARELGATGIDVIDAPVSGGPHGATARTLSVMVGGEESVFAREEGILRDVGARLVVRVGGAGAGQAVKLCNNLIAGATMVALAEACAIAEREGVDAATLFEILAASTADSRVLRVRFPLPGVDAAHPSSSDYQPLFALDLIVKDLALACELAEEVGLDVRMAASALAEYRRAQEAGHGSLDYSAVYLLVAGN